MQRTARWVCLVAMSLAAPLAAGCGSSSDDASASAAGGDLEGRLANDTGVTWLVDRDETGAVMFLTALTAPPAPDASASSTPREQAAVAFLQRYADLLGAGAGDLARELVLVGDLADPLAPGVHHLRFAQRIPGSDVRVFGADTFVHFEANGAIRFVAVGFVPDIAKISAQPVKSAADAHAAAEANLRARDPQARVASAKAPALVVYRAADGKGTLAWQVRLQALVNGALEAPELFVDASTADILEAHDTAAHANKTVTSSNFYFYHSDCGQKVPPAESSITYDDAFQPPLAPAPTNRLVRDGDATHSLIITDRYVAGDLPSAFFITAPIVSTDPTSFDFIDGHQGSGAGVSAHENLTLADDYFQSLGQDGWVGWDGKGRLPIIAAVHAWTIDPTGPKGPLPPARVVDITGFSNDTIYLGDGISQQEAIFTSPNCAFFPPAVALDVVAHEYTHGIVAHTANLGVKGEAGALNEGIADVLGAGAEHSLHPGDRNFIIGEEAWFAQGGLRNLRSPRSLPATFDKELMPRAYSERLSTTALDKDSGHVHDNGILAGHAFYLMTMGGTNEVSHVTVPASEALGWERAQPLWYLTLRSLDERFGKTFHDFARAQTNLTLLLAVPLPGKFPTAVVACAWRAVEVFTDADLRAYGLTCGKDPSAPPPAPPPPGGSGASDPNPCAGHGDHLVCDSLAPATAAVCKGGVRVNVALCADPEQRCKQASVSDPTAALGADGALECE